MPEAVPPATRIGVRMTLAGDPGELFADARALEAAGADSLWVEDTEPYVLLAALAAVTWRVRLIAPASAARGAGRATCEALSRGRLALADDLGRAGERWVNEPFPKDRAAWKVTRRTAAEKGVTGIVVPNDPRLMDLLRNPDQIEDRSDLNLATG
jgi:alkanesulfonate monooxygenase SsuD/methylene tetrahydromethanopterin reductase-like flavin-dependent oxidoreductase (luciferase family)